MVSYSQILNGVCGLTGLVFGELQVAEWTMLRTIADLRLGDAWEMEAWPEWMIVEERWFRGKWASGTTYNAKVEVYYPPAKKYFQSLSSGNLGNQPATGTDYGTENSAYWAECKTKYLAGNWVTGTNYTVGQQVYYVVTDKFYQCHTAHAAGGALTPDAIGASERWGELTRFDRYVGYEAAPEISLGEVFGAFNEDPRMTTTARDVTFELSRNGVQIVENRTSVWLKYRERRPLLIGDEWSKTRLYVAGEQVHFTSGGHGNFYDCAAATAAGESPGSAAAKWTLVRLPYVCHGWLIQQIAATWQSMNEQKAQAATSKKGGDAAMSREADKLFRQQGQVRRTQVGVR